MKIFINPRTLKSSTIFNRISLSPSYFSTSPEQVVPYEGPKIGRTVGEQEILYLKQPDMPENPKILKTSILGVPNAGKSTLVNRLMNRRISAVSTKINTTRNRINAVFTDNDTQMLILDTPGIVTFKKSKKFNLDRQMIIDPHSSLWESDLIIVVHDVSDEYSQNKLDSEVLKCLFAHPDKETVLVLNKTDRLKNKSVLLNLVSSLTGGLLNGKKFMEKKRERKDRFIRASMRDEEYEELFAKTAEKMNIQLEGSERTKKHDQVLELLEELKTCEEYLIKNQEKISFLEANDGENNEEETEIVVQNEQRITLEKLTDNYTPDKLTVSNQMQNKNDELNLINSISGELTPSTAPLRRIEDISPVDFKRDLLETTDWHMYYKKLSSLSLLVRGKTYWPYFNQVFMVSAKHNDGVDDLKRYLLSRAKPGEWIFSREMLTDQMPQEIAEMCVREKMLESLPEEIPYELGLEIAHWEIDSNDCLNIAVNILPGCSRYKYKRHTQALFQNQGRLLQYITRESLQEIRNAFQCEVKLKLIVVTKGSSKK